MTAEVPMAAADLPPRMSELLGHMITEKPLKQIAWEMGLAADSVKQYTTRLYHLIGVGSRQELTVLYWRDGRFR